MVMDPYDKMRAAVHRTSPITDADWALCLPGLRLRRVRKGEHFIEEGKTYKEIGFVLSGLFRAYYLKDGEELNCNFYFEGQWPKAYHNFLAQTPSRMWVQAIEDSEIILISYDHLQFLFRESRSWERFGRVATEKAFVAAQLRNETLLLDTAEERYLNVQRLHPELMERVPLYHIASYIGIRQPSLSRIRSRLARKGTGL